MEEKLIWFPLNIYFSSPRKALEVEKFFLKENIRVFLPKCYSECCDRNGKVCRQLMPAFNNLIFVQCSKNTIARYIDGEFPLLPNVRYIYRRVFDTSTEDKVITVSDEEMNNFMHVVEGNEEYIIYISSTDLVGKSSRPCVIKGGRFREAKGELIRIQKNRHFVVRINDLACVAVTYIPIKDINIGLSEIPSDLLAKL